ncbi:MAG: hypothetical protein ETSY1_19345 [Candidatus Entotheonella factor]|uniref:DUF4058 domain-containing protein n=1 Tax=Entotheonella factor TaxID=1429438 RepID=W4LLU2_ENTF1|nr:MAG: hypothetical protein ETSY1_19345 [Candidatus Entotheonella factor]
MQLLDHFHPPLSKLRHWESFHARWAASIADALNSDLLPAEYFAEVQVHVGSRVEVDVGTFEETSAQVDNTSGAPTTTAMLAAPPWAPPEPAMHMPAVFPDSLEVLVFHTETGPTLAAAIELISPGNKDREAHRRAFAAKCSSYLQQGIGLMIIDIVTNRQANLHNTLVQMLNAGEPFVLPDERLYATAYQPVRRADADIINVWPATLAVGRELPLMPLPIHAQLVLPLHLGATYAEACQRSRLPSTQPSSDASNV